jgi:arginine decarboxylase
MTFTLKNYPLIIYDAHIHNENYSGQASRNLVAELKAQDLDVINVDSADDCLKSIAYMTNISGILLDWDSFDANAKHFDDYLLQITALNDQLPIFIMTQEHELDDSSISSLKNKVHFFWKYADTYDFIVGRIKQSIEDYFNSLLPPFFKALTTYVKKNKYIWSTPGHMGGVAFLKSPVGRLFYDFYGENVFRGDLSISVPELGTLLEHSGVNGEAEKFAAEVFGADHTFFVTNGTSTSNKIVVMSCVGKNAVAIIDRNCHKSLQQAMTMSDIIPIYFQPTRNAFGIIGTIPLHEFTPEAIQQKINNSPLIKDKNITPSIATITNSTYDGLIYNVEKIKDQLAKSQLPHLHFDEAWYPYAHFHPLYSGKHAMGTYHKTDHPTVYGTQSTHKLLAAFSQASMIHVKNGLVPLNVDLFNTTYMMHSSTSPQYNIIASLDVSSKMMEGQFGYRIISEAISEAIAFRQEFARIKAGFQKNGEWFFDIWQPDAVNNIQRVATHHFMDITSQDASTWMLNQHEQWHGFKIDEPDFVMLDPIKVTILSPGINSDFSYQKLGIPGSIVSKFLMNKGVVDEKTSFYSMLFLFSIGVNKSKAMNLISDLISFKTAYDKNTSFLELFPDLIDMHSRVYQNMGLKDVCQEMHLFLKKENASKLLMDAFAILPKQVITPNAAYQHIVNANCQEFPIEELHDKIILDMLSPYPPGIPLVMPGESITKEHQDLIEYLLMLERFDNKFPGFENDVHGVNVRIVNGKRKYFVPCVDK